MVADCTEYGMQNGIPGDIGREPTRSRSLGIGIPYSALGRVVITAKNIWSVRKASNPYRVSSGRLEIVFQVGRNAHAGELILSVDDVVNGVSKTGLANAVHDNVHDVVASGDSVTSSFLPRA